MLFQCFRRENARNYCQRHFLSESLVSSRWTSGFCEEPDKLTFCGFFCKCTDRCTHVATQNFVISCFFHSFPKYYLTRFALSPRWGVLQYSDGAKYAFISSPGFMPFLLISGFSFNHKDQRKEDEVGRVLWKNSTKIELNWSRSPTAESVVEFQMISLGTSADSKGRLSLSTANTCWLTVDWLWMCGMLADRKFSETHFIEPQQGNDSPHYVVDYVEIDAMPEV